MFGLIVFVAVVVLLIAFTGLPYCAVVAAALGKLTG